MNVLLQQFARRRKAGVVVFLVVYSLLIPFRDTAAQVVIAHPSVAADSVSRTALRAIFSGRLQSLGGQRLTVFVYSDRDPLHEAFSKEILGVFPYQLRDAWNRAVFAGTGAAPVTVASEAEMLGRVAQTIGAIGYVAESIPHEGVRFLAIEGATR